MNPKATKIALYSQCTLGALSTAFGAAALITTLPFTAIPLAAAIGLTAGGVLVVGVSGVALKAFASRFDRRSNAA